MKSKNALVLKLTAMVLSLLLIFSCLPVSALADAPTDNQDETYSEPQSEDATSNDVDPSQEDETDVVENGDQEGSDVEKPTDAENLTEDEAPTEVETLTEGEELAEGEKPTEDGETNAEENPTEASADKAEPIVEKKRLLTTAADQDEGNEDDLPDGYYLIRPDWTINDVNLSEKFRSNPSNAGEYMLNADLSVNDSIKVVKIANGKITTWYPDGEGNEYTVDADHAGHRTIYFKTSANDDWSEFGGYFFIDDEENTVSDPTPDETVPVIDPDYTVKYYINGSEWTPESNETKWVGPSDTVNVELKATDDASGIDSFWCNGKRADVVSDESDVYTVTVSKAGKGQSGQLKLKVKDGANNMSAELALPIKVDDVAPLKTDVLSGVFSSETLNFLGFGIYDKNNLTLTITVSPNEGSPITGITVKAKKYIADKGVKSADYVETTLTATGEKPTKNEDGTYSQSFLLEKGEAGYSYEIYITEITDEAGNSYKSGTDPSKNISILDIPTLSAKKGTDVSKEANGVMDVVATELAPYCGGLTVEGTKVTVGEDTLYTNLGSSQNLTVEATITDELSGLDLNSISLSAESAKKESISLESVTVNPKTYGSEALSGKLIEAEVSATIPKTISDAVLPSGAYTLTLKATNNSGNEATYPFVVKIDNSKPAVSVTSTERNNWSPDPVEVVFEVTDDVPSCGVKSVQISADYQDGTKGTIPAKNITDNGDGTYSFNATKNGTYHITATDNFDRVSDAVDASVTKYDNTAPVIKNIKYSNAENNEQKWTKDPVTVTFDVDDQVYTDGTAAAVYDGSGIVTITEGEKEGDKLIYPYTLSVAAENESETVGSLTISEDTSTKGLYHASFVASSQTTYTISVSDRAGNAATDVTTEEVKYDNVPPEITKVVFDKVTNLRDYGIYSNEAITGKVYVKCSGVGGHGAPLSELVITNETEDGATVINEPEINVEDEEKGIYSRSFKLEVDDAKPYKLKFSAKEENGLTDTVENFKHTCGLEAHKDHVIGVFVGNEEIAGIIRDLFEIVVTILPPNVSDFTVSGMAGGPVEGKHNDFNYYKGSTGTISVTMRDDFAGINPATLTLTMNDTSILKNAKTSISAVYADNSGNNAEFSGSIEDLINQSNSNKVKSVTLTYDLSGLQSKGVIPSGEYKFALSGKNLAGNKNDNEFSLYVDNTKPVITKFDLSDGNSAKNDQTALTPEPNTYGYFFKYQTTVTVHATDLLNDFQGVGVKWIYFRTQNSNWVRKAADADETASFTVDANYKGKIYAYAVDRLDNTGSNYGPSDNGSSVRMLVVESSAKHAETSSASISINTSPVANDYNGHPLFNGSVNVSFLVTDTYSGIANVTYTVSDIDGNVASYGSDVNLYGSTVSGGWTVGATDANLVTKLTKSITINPYSNAKYNCNNIKITLKAFDNAGHEITAAQKVVSIDITKPTIRIAYSPATPTNTYNSENYYNGTRTATITVTERNFDPADFSIEKLIALEGAKPALVGTSNWSRGNYTDASTHVAVVTFDTDGKYRVDCDYTDMAKNPAVKDFSVDTFYIDKTKPTLTVTLNSSATPYNRYYNKTVTANITINEHNFSADSAYLTYSPVATGPDNSSSATAPQIDGWSGGGDVHTASITFAADGKYSFKIGFKDLATNAADDHNESDFYVDTKADKPVITRVENGKAYNGVIAPMIEYTDYNFDNSNYTFKLTRSSYDLKEMKQATEQVNYSAEDNEKQFGRIVTYQNFPTNELSEGVYTLEASYTDLAKNTSDAAIVMFSVNRYGSVFLLGTSDTEKLVENQYSNDVPDVVIREINVDKVKEQTVSVSHNSFDVPLQKGKDYEIASVGGGGKWHEYVYTLFSDNFNEEGDYTVTVSSVDTFDNRITNRTANTKSKTVRNCPVSFIVDKTAPVITISGVDDNGYYSDASKTVSIVCTDENINKESLVVMLDGEPVDLTAAKAVVDDSLVGEIDIEYPVEADGKETTHSLKVEVKDFAENDNDGSIGAFTLSATFFTMFFHNTLALVLSGAVLAALIALAIILIIKKRGKNVNV